MTPHICIIKNDSPLDRATFQFLLQFVSPQKLERILRQRVKQNADNMLVGTALTSHLLFKVFHIPLYKQHIVYGLYGKPYLRDYPNVNFNISHSGIYVACAVADCPVGVDVQMIEEYKPNVTDRVCSKAEVAKIAASDNPAAEFTKLWTRKEAYAKLAGDGIGRIASFAEQMAYVHLTTYPLKGAFLSVAYHIRE